MPLNELASENRITGCNSVLRMLKAEKVAKLFLSKEADLAVLREIIEEAQKKNIPIEWVDKSLQLGRACAISRKTAVAGLLKRRNR